MSNELRIEHDPGVQVYAEIWNSVGQILTPAGLTFGAPVKASWPAYDVPLPETEEDSGVYLADFPALPAGRYEVTYRERLGADPAVTDDRLGGEEVHWDGAARVGLSDLSFGSNGAVEHTHTVYEPGGATPLAGCSVYVTVNADGTGLRSDTRITDALGRVRFSLNPGTYYFHHSHPDYTFGNDPDEETVSA